MVMMFIHKWRTCTMTGKCRVIIQERFCINIINKFIKDNSFESYRSQQSIDHSGSIKMGRGVRKTYFHQQIIKDARKINFLLSKEISQIVFGGVIS